MSVLLPRLELDHGQRPDVLVGTSIGALNAAYLAAHAHEHVADVLTQGADRWRRIVYSELLAPILSFREMTRVGRLALSMFFPRVVPYSLLDPTPLAATVADLIDFDHIRSNICNPKVGLQMLLRM
jgi:NTE family protein